MILGRDGRFDVKKEGSIVINALAGAAIVRVERPYLLAAPERIPPGLMPYVHHEPRSSGAKLRRLATALRQWFLAQALKAGVRSTRALQRLRRRAERRVREYPLHRVEAHSCE